MSCSCCVDVEVDAELRQVREDLIVSRRTNQAYAAELMRLRDEAAVAVLDADKWRQVARDLLLQAALSSLIGQGG